MPYEDSTVFIKKLNQIVIIGIEALSRQMCLSVYPIKFRHIEN